MTESGHQALTGGIDGRPMTDVRDSGLPEGASFTPLVEGNVEADDMHAGLAMCLTQSVLELTQAGDPATLSPHGSCDRREVD